MKKWIVIALSVVFFSLILWSCSDDNSTDPTNQAPTFSEELYYGGIMGMSQNFLLYLNLNDSINASDIWNLEYFSNRDNWYWEEHIDWANDTTFCVLDMMELSMSTDTSAWYGGVELTGNMIFAESDITIIEFAHNLPIEKTQQYYEMIGTYHQFSCGWSDYDGYERDADGEIIYIVDYAVNGIDTLAVRPKLKLNNANEFNYNDYGH